MNSWLRGANFIAPLIDRGVKQHNGETSKHDFHSLFTVLLPLSNSSSCNLAMDFKIKIVFDITSRDPGMFVGRHELRNSGR